MQIGMSGGVNQYYQNYAAKKTAKTSASDYFSGVQEKFAGVSMNMSNAYLFSRDSSTTLNISPEYVKKSQDDPETAQNLERLAGLAQSFPQYLNTHNTMPDGTTVSKVSFVVDENGGVSCNCEYSKPKADNDNSLSYYAKIKERREEEAEEERLEKLKSSRFDYTSGYTVRNVLERSFAASTGTVQDDA